MAQLTFNAASNQLLTHPSTGNGAFDLFISSNISNLTGLPSARLVVEYCDITPGDDVNIEKTFGIGVLLEGQLENNWVPIAYQFEPYVSPNNGNKRVIVVQRDISDFNAGIDDIMYVSGETLARISRQQGKATSTMRVRVVLRENGWPGGVKGQGAFTSVRVNIYGELYDDA